jgi:hypothetical protein
MILKWEKFLEKWSYPESIREVCDIIYDECVKRIDEFSGDNIYNEIINIPYTKLKDIQTNVSFSQFPVEHVQMALNLIGNDPDYYKGSFHSIKQSKEEARQEYSYLQPSKGKKVDKSIFLRLSFAVGMQDNIDDTKLNIKQLINHEVQHGYDQYNQIVNNKSYNDEYYFYRTILYFIEQHSDVLSNDVVEFLLAIYNCSETEMRSIMAEPGDKFNTKEWKNILGKRDLHNIDIDGVADRMKKERNIQNLPEVLGDYYIQICELGNVTVNKKFVKICRKNYDSFIDYWVPVIKRKMDTIKRKTAKRINESVSKPQKKYPVEKCLDMYTVAEELEKILGFHVTDIPNKESKYGTCNFYSWVGESQDPLFPKPSMADMAYEYQKAKYSTVGMDAKKYRYCEYDSIYELPIHYDSSQDGLKWVQKFNKFKNDMTKLMSKEWDNSNDKHINFGPKSNEWVNIILDKIHELYPEHYINGKIKIWSGRDEFDRGKLIFDHPYNESYFLSEIEQWIQDTFNINTDGLYEWILDCQFVEGRYWQRVWKYSMEDKNFRKNNIPDNIKQINEILRQMYKEKSLLIFIDYYKKIELLD